MTGFEFATATRIVFGLGALDQVGAIAAGFGRSALVVSGSHSERAEPLLDRLAAHGVGCTVFCVAGEPTVGLVGQGVSRLRDAGCDLVVGFGGGSAIDTGKAIAALATNPGDAFDYLEVIGRAQPLRHPPLPFIAVPTTAGSGAEVTRNAVLTSPEHGVKVSLRSPLMLPKVALVDPQLCLSLPPDVTAATGMDALSQLIEPYVSLRANSLTDALCRAGIPRAASALRRAFADGNDLSAREDMSLASLFGGLALANAGLGAVHGFAAPIGGRFPAPHGSVCARLLPLVFEANVQALRRRRPDSPLLPRFDEVARLLTGRPNATAQDGVQWLAELSEWLKIPPLSAYGLTDDDVPALVERAARASSMQANPIPLTDEEMMEILHRAM
ncbi:MAG: iron-containing alcohol dehydrogenase [Anaerolineae bacterium]|nr:iron-containing alcohol dehydrogenase [Anaerolineae bacterium]